MKFKKTIAIYSIIVGLAMIGTWSIQLLTGQARELQTAPIEIALAITADWTTAIVLIISGIGLLMNRIWALKLYLFTLGMLVYSLLISSGYFGQLGNTAFVILFIILLIFSMVFVVANIVQKTDDAKR